MSGAGAVIGYAHRARVGPRCSCGATAREAVRYGADYKSKRVYCPECGAALLMYAGNLRLYDEEWARRHDARIVAYRACEGLHT